MALSQIQPVSLREQVVEQIRTAIIEGRLRPNDHIVENVLTHQLGISRTPVREALILLERDGLVVSHPHRGCFVRNFTVDDVEDIFTMRTTLENFAGERIMDRLVEGDYLHLEALIEQQRKSIIAKDFKAVQTVDMSFHQYIVDKSNHALLIQNWRQIVAQIAAILYIRAEAVPDYDEQLVIHVHRLIVQAYRQHNLAELMRLNREINQRVAEECKFALKALAH